MILSVGLFTNVTTITTVTITTSISCPTPLTTTRLGGACGSFAGRIRKGSGGGSPDDPTSPR